MPHTTDHRTEEHSAQPSESNNTSEKILSEVLSNQAKPTERAADPAPSRWALSPEQKARVCEDAKQLIETERRWRESGCRQS